MNAALIEAARRIAPLVRACRDEGERERRLPARLRSDRAVQRHLIDLPWLDRAGGLRSAS